MSWKSTGPNSSFEGDSVPESMRPLILKLVENAIGSSITD